MKFGFQEELLLNFLDYEFHGLPVHNSLMKSN